MFVLTPGIADATTNLNVALEAVVQGGASANSDWNEVTNGYLHVKYSAPLDQSRKTYLQFDLTGLNPQPNLGATLTVSFTSTNLQRVKLWGLKQSYPGFNAGVTWNTVQANQTNSNDLLTSGSFTASQIGADVLIPLSGTTPYTFSIPRLGDFLFSNRVTLALTGAADASNNAAGLRLQRGQAVLTFNLGVPTNSNYDVYLVGGQSNADGRGATSDLTNSLSAWQLPQPDIRIYYANPINLDPQNPSYNTGWNILAPGFSVPPGFSGALPSTKFGPELSFARTLADAAPDRRLALIKVTQGGTSLSDDWNPAGGYMYATLTNIARTALQALTNEGAYYTLRGMIWHQGESDGSVATATYQSMLTNFINAVRRDLGVTNLPVVVGELATNRSITVRQAQFNVSESMPYVGFASSSNLPTLAANDPHFTATSQLTMGQRMAAALEIPPLTLTSASLAGTNLLVTAAGLARATCWLETTTNLPASPGSWAVVATNVFDASGRTIFGQPFRPDAAAVFFRLQAE
jgi:iduronate 2-sulfatase